MVTARSARQSIDQWPCTATRRSNRIPMSRCDGRLPALPRQCKIFGNKQLSAGLRPRLVSPRVSNISLVDWCDFDQRRTNDSLLPLQETSVSCACVSNYSAATNKHNDNVVHKSLHVDMSRAEIKL